MWMLSKMLDDIGIGYPECLVPSVHISLSFSWTIRLWDRLVAREVKA